MITDLDMSVEAGWEPYQPFTPQSSVSKMLLESIPKKVSGWLNLLGQDSSGEYDLLSWHFTPENGTVIYDKAGEKFFQIWWGEGGCSATDKRVEDIENNLEFFVGVEQDIYNELSRLQKQIHDRTAPERFLKGPYSRDLPTSETEVVQSEEA